MWFLTVPRSQVLMVKRCVKCVVIAFNSSHSGHSKFKKVPHGKELSYDLKKDWVFYLSKAEARILLTPWNWVAAWWPGQYNCLTGGWSVLQFLGLGPDPPWRSRLLVDPLVLLYCSCWMFPWGSILFLSPGGYVQPWVGPPGAHMLWGSSGWLWFQSLLYLRRFLGVRSMTPPTSY